MPEANPDFPQSVPCFSLNASGTFENARRRVLNSKDLFLGAREVFIRHENREYRLIITKAGKLILNK